MFRFLQHSFVIKAWTAVTFGAGQYWWGISISSDGKYQSAVVQGSSIWISSNYGLISCKL